MHTIVRNPTANRTFRQRGATDLAETLLKSSLEAASAMREEGSSAKVLVVEDEALIRMAVAEMIEQLGLAALEAGTAEEALALLQHDQEVGILLADLGLPGMDGRQLAEEARRLRPSLKVVIASGYPDDKTGADMVHLTKPYDLHELRRALGL